MKLDPKEYADWQIAQAAERSMKTIEQLGADLGLERDELIPYGRYVGKVDYTAVTERLAAAPRGRYVDVTAITPTPLGEGKSTTTIGLIQALALRGHRVSGAVRQPSGGPSMNVKGSAAGGGLSQCIPLSKLTLGLTGDIDAVTNAHNLAMVALTARMQHEFYASDAFLARRDLERLNIDPTRVEIGWVMDFCAQALRNIVIGLGGRRDGLTMQSRFDISVSSEVMAILSLATSLADFRERMGRIVVAYDKRGKPITTADLEVDGAMTAWMLEAFNPNLLQTIEGQPLFVHAGPFANIAIGQSSILADLLGLKLSDYHVTESGFGADIGLEKFWNIKCRHSGLRPDAAVLVVTVRALKCHGGGPDVRPGRPLDPEYDRPHPEWVEKGAENMLAHLDIIRRSGTTPVVCINRFSADSEEELALVRRIAEAQGVRVAVSDHWAKGGEGGLELADAVADACEESSEFRFLHGPESSIRERIETVATQVYGAEGVEYDAVARKKLDRLESLLKTQASGRNTQASGKKTQAPAQETGRSVQNTGGSVQETGASSQAERGLDLCMAKTQLSLSHDPGRKGVPKGWTLPVRDLLVYHGAGLVVPVTGEIKLMPGTASDPAFRRIDVDLETRKVTGLF